MATAHAYVSHKLMRLLREEIRSAKFKMSELKYYNTLSFLKGILTYILKEILANLIIYLKYTFGLGI